MTTAGATFQRLIDKIIGDLVLYAYAYLNDIVLTTDTFFQHMELLRKLTQRIKDAGLTIISEKSVICTDKVKYYI